MTNEQKEEIIYHLKRCNPKSAIGKGIILLAEEGRWKTTAEFKELISELKEIMSEGDSMQNILGKSYEFFKNYPE